MPQNIKEGYEFLGWYYVEGTKETLVEGNNLKLKGENGNKVLKAKWAYAGQFSIALKSSTSSTPDGDGESIFTITRTIPSGVSVSEDQQRVYYRTVNGTAVGGTVTVKGAAGEEKDRESANNFYHVGGNNTFALFDANNECYSIVDNERRMGLIDRNSGKAVVEFPVRKERASIRYYGHETPRETNGIFAHLFNISGTDTRYYMAELYRIESAKGIVTGVYGTREAVRNMTMPAGKILKKTVICGVKNKTIEHKQTIDNSSEYKTEYGPLDISDLFTTDLIYYYGQATGDPLVDIKVYISKADEDSTTFHNEYGIMYHIGDLEISDLDMDFDEDDAPCWYHVGSEYASWEQLSDGQIYFSGDTGDDGLGGTEFTVAGHMISITPQDSGDSGIAPDQIGIAPAATTDYKKGEKVRFSVIYDELIASCSNVRVNTDSFKDYMPLKDVRCTGGAGTNVLTFEGTAMEDFKNTTWESTGTNNILMDIKPVNGGSVKDLNGND